MEKKPPVNLTKEPDKLGEVVGGGSASEGLSGANWGEDTTAA